ncbi:hypothetical protein RRG08_055482 [Elysia crispata]|uniref:Uncharacterized protein n=1 Tax=Elysia crispata TaxID=231223 RepID=A0AAE0XR40_9GAST|nr:hypothetical protein RRG08_055482 [Elysia crispata]
MKLHKKTYACATKSQEVAKKPNKNCSVQEIFYFCITKVVARDWTMWTRRGGLKQPDAEIIGLSRDNRLTASTQRPPLTKRSF